MASGIMGTVAESTAPYTKVFRDLRIYGDQPAIAALIARIEMLLDGGWFRDRDRELMFPQMTGVHYVFVRPSGEDRQGVAMLLDAKRYGVNVSNIAPERHRLCCEEYNAILVDFFLRFIDPAAVELELLWELTSDD